MATVAPSADNTADLLQNLSLDTQNKNLEIPEPTKKTSVYQYGSVDPSVSSNGQGPTSERSVTPFLPDATDPTLCYLPNGYASTAYYYGSFNGTNNDLVDYSRYPNTDAAEMTAGMYGENGSVVYHNAYGYPSYGPYSPATSPVPTLGTDGQLYGPQHYQYPPFFQPVTPTNGSFAPSQSATSQGELSNPTATDQKPSSVDTTKSTSSTIANGGGMKGNNNSTPYRPLYQNSNLSNTYGRGTYPGGYQDPRSEFDGQYKNTSPFSKSNNLQSSKNHGFHQNSGFMGIHHPGPVPGMGSNHNYMNRMHPNKFYGQYGNTYRTGMGYGHNGYDARISAHGWLAVDSKYKPRGRGNGYFSYRSDGIDGLNELNRGPRAKGFKNQKGLVPVTLSVKGQNLSPIEAVSEEKDAAFIVPDCEQYNRADFPEDYADAKFFIIKSYSEDDVHKSIKYSVWASTPNGNKKLDAAYQEAQQKSGECPVFLFFSVNTSGQFVGLAEMAGPVDFEKNMEYWQQDKWTGYFPLKWHIVKDVPNSLLKHITLENNENKPVTNSRDTQEVKLEQGLKMVKIFKDLSCKTCILDDFGFYEKRQKIIQEKKIKQQHFQKQIVEEKPIEGKNDVANGLEKTADLVSDVVKETISTPHSNGHLKHLENELVGKTGDSSNVSKPDASEKKILANGTANGC